MRTDPRATYRVQLREEFDFDAAAAVVDYLERLGCSHLYCSPYMQATAHSPHGYDVVDPTRVSRDLGGEPGLQRLDAALRRAHMGQLLDVVPNHMCIADAANTWWWDVLRNGRDSRYAAFFDIDWDAPGLEGRVLLPVLDEPRTAALAGRGLRVVEGVVGFELRYEGMAFPLRSGSASAPGPVSVETLDAQHYVLEFAKTAGAHVNYRRFFDVSSLAGLRVEDGGVFDSVLARALELVDDGTVDGLRVDHIDGLRDPAGFASRLRAEAPTAWIIAEKILATDERPPGAWPIDGTTGYEFGALLTSLFVHPAGLSELSHLYRDVTGDHQGFQEHAQRARAEVLKSLFSAELGRLTRVAATAGIQGAQEELGALVAGMPRYRLYPRAGQPLSRDDEDALTVADQRAREAAACDGARLAAVVSALREEGHTSPARNELRDRFQQVAGAVMAKGVEDTAFYRYVRLVALNEVGADPDRTASLDDFDAACRRTLSDRPLTLLATATHDTKRGEDARLRVAMLSEMPERWRLGVAHLDRLAARHRGTHSPTPQAEYLLYQTLVAAHPIDAGRAWAYMLKASREAKDATSWIEPDRPYEADLERFVRGMIADPDVDAEILALIGAMTPEWQSLSLSQTLLKLTSPGIPDIYQGSELWDLRLVDPDNRTPVDYEVRRALLRDVTGPERDGFMSRLAEGGPKLRLIAAALAVRARCAEAFGRGSGYERLPVSGSRSEHAICFSRMRPDGEPAALTIAVRWPLLLRPGWLDTKVRLPGGFWLDALTGQGVPGGEQRLESMLDEAPVALLERA